MLVRDAGGELAGAGRENELILLLQHDDQRPGAHERPRALDNQLEDVTEGVSTTSAMVEMAASRGIDMPIATAVHSVISGSATVDEAIEDLLARPLRPEI